MLRFFDILFAFFGLCVGLPLFLVLTLIGAIVTGSPFFCQVRIGKHQRPFLLYKFRTMKVDTESVATHLVNPKSITRFGHFLRRTKLDELPQLWNVLKGDMSLVGPRPCLMSQHELINERARRGVYSLRPGITGIAQVNGIDMSDPTTLAEADALMAQKMSLSLYLKCIAMTLSGSGQGDRIQKS